MNVFPSRKKSCCKPTAAAAQRNGLPGSIFSGTWRNNAPRNDLRTWCIWLAVSLSSCATITQDEATAGMRGWTRAQVLACAGAPMREAGEGNMRVLTYDAAFVIGGIFHQCVVSISLQNARVSRVSYNGHGPTCQTVLTNCIAK